MKLIDKNTLLGIGATLLTVLAIAQPAASIPRYEAPAEVELDGEKAKLRSNGEPVTGIVFYVGYLTGNPEQEFSYKGGLRHGISKTLNEKGVLVLKMEWEKGHAHGLAQEFYPNGKKQSERTYVHSEIEGQYLEWYETGELRLQGSFWKSQKNGRWVHFEKDGAIKELMLFEKGVLRTGLLSSADIELFLSARASNGQMQPSKTSP